MVDKTVYSREQVEQQYGFYIDGMLKNLLDEVIKKVKLQDFDFSLIIDGDVGVGKSVLAMQVCKYLDSQFSLNAICFTADQFMEKSAAVSQFSAVLQDEAFSAAFSRSAMSEVNKSLLAFAAEMRQKNLFTVFVLPSFFDLDRNLALHRCNALIHVYLDKEGNRGQYLIFPKRQKNLLYLTGKKTYSYARPYSPYPPCEFKNQYVVDELEYRRLKAEAFRNRVKAKNETMRDKLHKHQRDLLITHLAELGTSPIELSKLLEDQISPSALYRIIQLTKEKPDEPAT